MHVRQIFPSAIRNICVLTLCIALALCQTSENETDVFAESGSYLIVYCNANPPGSHAAYLQTLIPYMQSSLQAVLRDLDRGTASPAYRAFFKTNNNLDAVRQVFTDIINGSKVLTVDALKVTRWSPPVLVCADADESSLNYLLNECNTPIRPVMLVIEPAKFVSICPIFWTIPRIARKAACPRVANGELLTEPWNLRTTQYAVLVHEMVHVYNRFNVKEEVYDMADVVGLDATRSLENAQNFASYAAGEWCISVCDAGQCGR
ncbi:MAG: hypothetical protein Q9175_002177 [Cornicularia normoerica]